MMQIDFSADALFERYCLNGTKFAARNDLTGTIAVWNHASTQEQIMQDVAEFVGYHATHIRPHLRCPFQGYANLEFAGQMV